MTCPDCHGRSPVLDSRRSGREVRRNRRCDRCGFRFTTYEMFVGVGEEMRLRRRTKTSGIDVARNTRVDTRLGRLGEVPA